MIYYNTREGNDNKRPGYSTTAHLDLCEVVVIGNQSSDVLTGVDFND